MMRSVFRVGYVICVGQVVCDEVSDCVEVSALRYVYVARTRPRMLFHSLCFFFYIHRRGIGFEIIVCLCPS